MSSENNRAIALTNAVQVGLSVGADSEAVLSIAEVFLSFLDGAGGTPATKPAATKPAATKPAATKPAATKPAATKPAATKPAPKTEDELVEGAADEATSGEVTEQMVGDTITALLGANKRKEATALLAEYNAKSKSTLAVENYEEFYQRAQDLLMA